MIRVAYADPPYVGRSGYYDHDDRRRWDDPAEHVALMTQLEMAFDGWALSCSSPSLRDLLPGAPARARVGVWAKSNPPNYDRVAYGWEPVIFAPGRETGASCRDYLVASAGAYPGRDVGLVGAKPVAFAALAARPARVLRRRRPRRPLSRHRRARPRRGTGPVVRAAVVTVPVDVTPGGEWRVHVTPGRLDELVALGWVVVVDGRAALTVEGGRRLVGLVDGSEP